MTNMWYSLFVADQTCFPPPLLGAMVGLEHRTPRWRKDEIRHCKARYMDVRYPAAPLPSSTPFVHSHGLRPHNNCERFWLCREKPQVAPMSDLITCYSFEGQGFANNTKCASSSSCCATAAQCRSDRLCTSNNNSTVLVRATCSFNPWDVDSCAQICLYGELKIFQRAVDHSSH